MYLNVFQLLFHNKCFADVCGTFVDLRTWLWCLNNFQEKNWNLNSENMSKWRVKYVLCQDDMKLWILLWELWGYFGWKNFAEIRNYFKDFSVLTVWCIFGRYFTVNYLMYFLLFFIIYFVIYFMINFMKCFMIYLVSLHTFLYTFRISFYSQFRYIFLDTSRTQFGVNTLDKYVKECRNRFYLFSFNLHSKGFTFEKTSLLRVLSASAV